MFPIYLKSYCKGSMCNKMIIQLFLRLHNKYKTRFFPSGNYLIFGRDITHIKTKRLLVKLKGENSKQWEEKKWRKLPWEHRNWDSYEHITHSCIHTSNIYRESNILSLKSETQARSKTEPWQYDIISKRVGAGRSKAAWAWILTLPLRNNGAF